MRLTRKYFAEKFPHTNCASCVWFDSSVSLQELEDSYEDLVKDNLCLMSDYAFPCQFRDIGKASPNHV